jgi:hypothetical protein
MKRITAIEYSPDIKHPDFWQIKTEYDISCVGGRTLLVSADVLHEIAINFIESKFKERQGRNKTIKQLAEELVKNGSFDDIEVNNEIKLDIPALDVK